MGSLLLYYTVIIARPHCSQKHSNVTDGRTDGQTAPSYYSRNS